jgi:glycosyltransferase involved in cell wall biosynthesis
MPASKPRIAYLFSRYPVVSQTFCDSEMLALEGMGFDLEIASLNRPPNSFRHERLDRLKAEIHYPPPGDLLDTMAKDPEFKATLGPMISRHGEVYGTGYKPDTRARNAWYFAKVFLRLGVQHVHVHFANRATHTALFLKKLGFTFSFTAHAQDFMFDLGSNALLSEMATEASFVIAVSDYSRDLLCEMCPESAEKIVRIYNGIELDDFRKTPVKQTPPLRIVSVGRLIEFKGFQHLIDACGLLKKRGIAVQTHIVGEGPMRADLEARIAKNDVADCVKLLGVRSQEEIKRELHEADIFSLACVVDPVGASDILPTVITEAMACSLPVISTTVAGIPEMVANGASGLLVEPGDAAALADAIADLGSDAEVRRRMGEEGRRRAERLFVLGKTAGVLGEHFSKLCEKSAAAKVKRADAPIAYLVHEWKGEALCKDAPSAKDGVRWLAESASKPERGMDRGTLEQIEALPDASVIESIWLRRSTLRHAVESVRSRMGDAVDSTAFYIAARHAVYLADILPRREVRHLHAWRSDAVVTVWLVKQLLPALKVSCAIEENPVAPRSLLSRLIPDFDLFSISDAKLSEQIDKPHTDYLQLIAPFRHKELRLGPLKVKRKVAAPAQDRKAIEKAWLGIIRKSIA